MTNLRALLLLLVAVASADASVAKKSSPAALEPFLGNYDVKDSCQYNLCGPDWQSGNGIRSQSGPRGGGAGTPGGLGGAHGPAESCAAACSATAHKLANSKFKREFLWGKCAGMCMEKYPTKDYRWVVRYFFRLRSLSIARFPGVAVRYVQGEANSPATFPSKSGNPPHPVC